LAISYLANRGIYRAIFPTIMPWLMTLAPMNEAIGCETMQKKSLSKEIFHRYDPGGHARCKDSITIKKAQVFL
jgi:hypothetical protein